MRITFLSAGLMIAIGSLLNWGFDENIAPNTDTSTQHIHTNLPACFGYEASCIQISANNLDMENFDPSFDNDKAKLTAQKMPVPENIMAQNRITEDAIITKINYELGGLISENEARQRINNYPNYPNLPTPRIRYTN